MQKLKYLGICLVILLLGGLIYFASTHKYSDSHFRKEGIRVRLPENAFMVDDCNYKDLAYCEKTFNLNNEDIKMAFEYLNFKENGYPTTIKVSLNNQVFYSNNNILSTDQGLNNYIEFNNFYIMKDKYIIFTIIEQGNATLYILDSKGNIILKEHEIDTDNMVINPYKYNFISYEDNIIKVYASRLKDNKYQDQNICNIKDNTIVEAYYLYTLKNDQFIKKQSETIKAKEYIIDNNTLVCNSEKETTYEAGTSTNNTKAIFNFKIINNKKIEFQSAKNVLEFELNKGISYSLKS